MGMFRNEELPGEVRELPEDLAALDGLLRDPALLEPIAAHWRGEAVSHGRPTIPMEVYVRLMVVKAHGLGVRDAGQGGLGLAAPAALLASVRSPRAVRADARPCRGRHG